VLLELGGDTPAIDFGLHALQCSAFCGRFDELVRLGGGVVEGAGDDPGCSGHGYRDSVAGP
jgi:hypothetical protein